MIKVIALEQTAEVVTGGPIRETPEGHTPPDLGRTR